MGDPFGRSPPLPLIFPRRLLVLVTSLAEKDDELQAGRAFTVEHGSPSFHFFFFFVFSSFLFSLSFSFSVHRQLGCTPRCVLSTDDEIGIKHIPFFTVSVNAKRVDSLGGVLRWRGWCRAATWAVCRYVTSPWNKSALENYFSTLPFAGLFERYSKWSFLTYVREHTLIRGALRLLLRKAAPRNYCISTFSPFVGNVNYGRKKWIFVKCVNNNFLNILYIYIFVIRILFCWYSFLGIRFWECNLKLEWK